jgi:hypothetical protein
VVAEQQSGRADAELHSVIGLIASAPWSALAPWIWLSKAGSKTPVSAVGTYAGLPVGAEVCKSGVVTEVTCGEVLSKTYSANSATWVPNQMDFIRTTVCSIPGDSGAPVYTVSRDNRTAQGIVSSGSAKPCSDPEFSSTFGHIEFAEDALGVNVTTAP